MPAQILYGLTIAALLAPLAAAGTDGIPPSYLVTATHPRWGAGVGHMWGDPDVGVRMSLDLLSGYGTFWFTVYGHHDAHATPAGDIIVDDWFRPGGNGPERFVASYHVDANGDATGVAAGGGKLNQFVITVHGHT